MYTMHDEAGTEEVLVGKSHFPIRALGGVFHRYLNTDEPFIAND